MASTAKNRSLITDVAVVPTAAGFQPGDTVIAPTAGTVRQIGIVAGVKVLRADPLEAISNIGFGMHIFSGPLVVTPVASNILRAAGSVVRINGEAPPGPGVVNVSITATGAEQLLDVAAVTGTLLSVVIDPTGKQAMVQLYSDSLGNFAFNITADSTGLANFNAFTNGDITAQVTGTFPA